MSKRKYYRRSSSRELLVKKYRAMFQIPENLIHYSETDYKAAERRFVKSAMEQGIRERAEEISQE